MGTSGPAVRSVVAYMVRRWRLSDSFLFTWLVSYVVHSFFNGTFAEGVSVCFLWSLPFGQVVTWSRLEATLSVGLLNIQVGRTTFCNLEHPEVVCGQVLEVTFTREQLERH